MSDKDEKILLAAKANAAGLVGPGPQEQACLKRSVEYVREGLKNADSLLLHPSDNVFGGKHFDMHDAHYQLLIEAAKYQYKDCVEAAAPIVKQSKQVSPMSIHK